MNIKQYLLAGAFLVGLACIFYACHHHERVRVLTSNEVMIDPEATHIALLGCTPHPTAYLRKYGMQAVRLENIALEDFIDMFDLRDSFKRTFALCKEQRIDQLIIAYLPIYYLEMRTMLGADFVVGCRTFLKRIASPIKQLIEEVVEEIGYHGIVSLILPTDEQLKKVPYAIKDLDERFRYLIKQFPRMKNVANVQCISIINNHASAEDDELIRYLKYEYLFEKRFVYKKLTIGKERFHMYV